MPSLTALLASLLALGSPAPEKPVTDENVPAEVAAPAEEVVAEPPPVATAPPPPSTTVAVTEPADDPGMVPTGDAPSPAAQQADSGTASAPGVSAAAKKKPRKTWLAVQSNIGLPDGLGVSAVFTPVEFLRLEMGAIGNGLNAGVRGGVTLLPKLWVVRPTLSVDGGRIFSGDANGVFGALVPEDVRPMLQGIAWNFASARLGIEVGSRRGAVQLQGGMSWIDVEIPGVAAVAQGLGSGTRFTGGAPHVQMWVPSVRVGLIVALF